MNVIRPSKSKAFQLAALGFFAGLPLSPVVAALGRNLGLNARIEWVLITCCILSALCGFVGWLLYRDHVFTFDTTGGAYTIADREVWKAQWANVRTTRGGPLGARLFWIDDKGRTLIASLVKDGMKPNLALQEAIKALPPPPPATAPSPIWKPLTIVGCFLSGISMAILLTQAPISWPLTPAAIAAVVAAAIGAPMALVGFVALAAAKTPPS